MLTVAFTRNLRNPHITTKNNILSSTWLGKQGRHTHLQNEVFKTKVTALAQLGQVEEKKRLELKHITPAHLSWLEKCKTKKPCSNLPELGGKTKHYLHRKKKPKPRSFNSVSHSNFPTPVLVKNPMQPTINRNSETDFWGGFQ